MYLIYNTNIAFINELNILCMTGMWSPCTGSQISSSTYSYVRTYIVALNVHIPISFVMTVKLYRYT